MRSVFLFTLLTRAFAGSDFVVVPLTVISAKTTRPEKVAKYQGSVPKPLSNKISGYLASFQLGGQDQFAIVNTGSADLWVFDSESGAEITYNTKTGQTVGVPFEIGYIDGTTAKGEYYLDDFVWGDINVKLQFGVSESKPFTTEYGVFGIADKSLEASADDDENNTYENLPSVLKSQGLTKSVSYSIYLNDHDGEIVFGAFDTSRFLGKVKVFDIDTKSGFRVPFAINGLYQIAELNCGSGLSYLDNNIVYEIATGFGAVWDDDERAFKVSKRPKGDLDFNFYGMHITMPNCELWHRYRSDGDSHFYYYFTILPNLLSGGFNMLGENFLRSAYVIYDLEHEQVAIGPSNPNPGLSHYVAIAGNGIPRRYTV